MGLIAAAPNSCQPVRVLNRQSREQSLEFRRCGISTRSFGRFFFSLYGNFFDLIHYLCRPHEACLIYVLPFKI